MTLRFSIAARLAVSCTLILLPAVWAGDTSVPNLTRAVADNLANVTVDSTFSGYSRDVLVDGKWIAPGEERELGTGSPDTLGNSGNTWVSAAEPGEHWIRLDWERPVTFNEVAVWWTKDDWRPRAFRVEYLSDQSWVPVTGETVWYRPLERYSVLTFPVREAQSIRVIQHSGEGPDRGFLAAQEILVFHRPRAQPALAGARPLRPEEAARLAPMLFERNIARLHESQPGAGAPLAFATPEEGVFCPALADGETAPIASLEQAVAVGVEWTVQHVIDGADLRVTDDATPTRTKGLRAEYHDGRRWLEDLRDVKIALGADGRLVTLRFRPVATTAFRLRATDDASRKLLRRTTELEINRYMPDTPHTWPAHLTDRPGLEEEVLASGAEPTYEFLASQTLSMRPARALLGLKDLKGEIGVAWDGTIVSTVPIRIAVGSAQHTLADYRDTVQRVLIDGWRPGTITTGRIGDVALRQTAFVWYSDPGRTRPALFLRVEVTNLGEEVFEDLLAVRCGGGQVAGSALVQDGRLLLAATATGQPGMQPGEMLLPLSIAPGQIVVIDFAQPHTVSVPVSEAAEYSAVDFDAALVAFRSYWDEILASAMTLTVPEDRINRMYKAILTQIFINADGDIMPYGSAPSVYDGKLYGIEESFAMLALALCGYAADAQRYMDATYLTREFLKKVPKYEVYADRHQQYRNGLQPHYATTLYRYCRDREWIGKHLELIRDCAEWTMEQRRTTMQDEAGEKPMHWGLLPKWSYGGDIAGLQCYALYANFACWRGLRDTAWLFSQLGDQQEAERYAAEAEQYRAAIDLAVRRNYQAGHDPPFLPLRLYASEPIGDDYYQLFAGVLLDLLPFEPGDEQEALITDYLERANLLFCGLPRFRRDVGPGGLDGLYGLGYVLSKLHQNRTQEFLLGFYSFLAYNLERDTFASRETNLLYASDLHVRSAYRVPDISDPIPCSSAVALLYLRHMLVTEQIGAGGLPTGALRLLSGAPQAWFAHDGRIRLCGAPTQFGAMSLEVHSQASDGRITALVTPPARDPWQEIHIRLPHPEGRQIQGVTVNGKEWTGFDAERATVTVPYGQGRYELVARY